MCPLPVPLFSSISEFRWNTRHVLIVHTLKVTVWRDYALRNIKAIVVPYIWDAGWGCSLFLALSLTQQTGNSGDWVRMRFEMQYVAKCREWQYKDDRFIVETGLAILDRDNASSGGGDKQWCCLTWSWCTRTDVSHVKQREQVDMKVSIRTSQQW